MRSPTYYYSNCLFCWLPDQIYIVLPDEIHIKIHLTQLCGKRNRIFTMKRNTTLMVRSTMLAMPSTTTSYANNALAHELHHTRTYYDHQFKVLQWNDLWIFYMKNIFIILLHIIHRIFLILKKKIFLIALSLQCLLAMIKALNKTKETWN